MFIGLALINLGSHLLRQTISLLKTTISLVDPLKKDCCTESANLSKCNRIKRLLGTLNSLSQLVWAHSKSCQHFLHYIVSLSLSLSLSLAYTPSLFVYINVLSSAKLHSTFYRLCVKIYRFCELISGIFSDADALKCSISSKKILRFKEHKLFK